MKESESQTTTESSHNEAGYAQNNSPNKTNSLRCKCGCNTKIILHYPYHGKWHAIPRYIKGHSVRDYNKNHDLRGNNNPAKRPEVKQKIRAWHERHENPAKRPEVKEKIRNTIKKLCKTQEHILAIRKGTLLAMQRPEVIARQKANYRPYKKPDHLKNHETCMWCAKTFIIPRSHHRQFCSLRCATLNKNYYQKEHDTDIEVLMEQYLIKKGIEYEKQKRIGDFTITDFFLPPKTCLYCDGVGEG